MTCCRRPSPLCLLYISLAKTHEALKPADLCYLSGIYFEIDLDYVFPDYFLSGGDFNYVGPNGKSVLYLAIEENLEDVATVCSQHIF